MKRILFFLVLLAACKSPHTYGATNGGPPNAVNITGSASAGGTILGLDTPLNVAITGTSDGGAAEPVTISNDAGNPVPVTGTVTADTTGADLALNKTVCWNSPVSSGVIADAGTVSWVKGAVTNRGTLSADYLFFCGQTALDAGGLADSGLGATVDIYCPALGYCIQPDFPQACAGGLAWYSSSTANFVTTDAGTQAGQVCVEIR